MSPATRENSPGPGLTDWYLFLHSAGGSVWSFLAVSAFLIKSDLQKHGDMPFCVYVCVRALCTSVDVYGVGDDGRSWVPVRLKPKSTTVFILFRVWTTLKPPTPTYSPPFTQPPTYPPIPLSDQVESKLARPAMKLALWSQVKTIIVCLSKGALSKEMNANGHIRLVPGAKTRSMGKKQNKPNMRSIPEFANWMGPLTDTTWCYLFANLC